MPCAPTGCKNSGQSLRDMTHMFLESQSEGPKQSQVVLRRTGPENEMWTIISYWFVANVLMSISVEYITDMRKYTQQATPSLTHLTSDYTNPPFTLLVWTVLGP